MGKKKMGGAVGFPPEPVDTALVPGRVYELSRMGRAEKIELFEPAARGVMGWTTGRTVAHLERGDRFLVIEPAPHPWEDVWIVLFEGILGACMVDRGWELQALVEVSE